MCFWQKGNNNQFLFIVEPHISFETTLGYRTQKFNDIRNEFIKESNQQKDADMESKL